MDDTRLVVQHRVLRGCLPGPSASHAHHVYHVSGLQSFGIGMTAGPPPLSIVCYRRIMPLQKQPVEVPWWGIDLTVPLSYTNTSLCALLSFCLPAWTFFPLASFYPFAITGCPDTARILVERHWLSLIHNIFFCHRPKLCFISIRHWPRLVTIKQASLGVSAVYRVAPAPPCT